MIKLKSLLETFKPKERNLIGDVHNFIQTFNILKYDNPLLYAMIDKKYGIDKLQKPAKDLVDWADSMEGWTRSDYWDEARKLGLEKEVEADYKKLEKQHS